MTSIFFPVKSAESSIAGGTPPPGHQTLLSLVGIVFHPSGLTVVLVLGLKSMQSSASTKNVRVGASGTIHM